MTRHLPEHFDGITGTDRTTDVLLSLDPQALAHREALLAVARHLLTATLVGNPAPAVAQMYQRICCPRPGDLVAERTSFGIMRDSTRRLKMLGVLLAQRTEWLYTQEQWRQVIADDPREEPITVQAVYLQYGPRAGDVCRWVDGIFLAVPISQDFFDPPEPTPGSPSWSCATGDMRSLLADAGFDVASHG